MTVATTMRNAVGSIALFLLGATVPVLGDDVDISLTAQGFCIKKTEMKCEEVALPDASVDLERLPKLPNGTRVVYFFSDQRVGADSMIVHALEAEDFDQSADYAIPQTLAGKPADLPAKLKAVADKVSHGGAVLITPFRVSGNGAKVVRVFSSIPVRGPGVFAGQVVDLDGNPVSTSKRVSFTVTRGSGQAAARKKPAGGSNTMGVIEGDG